MLMKEVPCHIRAVKELAIKIKIPEGAPESVLKLANELLESEDTSIEVTSDDSFELTWRIQFTWRTLDPENPIHFDLGHRLTPRWNAIQILYDYADDENKDKIYWLTDLFECIGA